MQDTGAPPPAPICHLFKHRRQALTTTAVLLCASLWGESPLLLVPPAYGRDIRLRARKELRCCKDCTTQVHRSDRLYKPRLITAGKGDWHVKSPDI